MSVPAPAAVASEHDLRRHFAGKRQGERFRSTHLALLASEHGRLWAKAVNISRSGVLLSVVDPRAGRFESRADLGRFTEQVLERFPLGLTIRFLDGLFTVNARVVRVTIDPDSPEPAPLLACRFRKPLARHHCAVLGFLDSEDPSESEPSDAEVDALLHM